MRRTVIPFGNGAGKFRPDKSAAAFKRDCAAHLFFAVENFQPVPFVEGSAGKYTLLAHYSYGHSDVPGRIGITNLFAPVKIGVLGSSPLLYISYSVFLSDFVKLLSKSREYTLEVAPAYSARRCVPLF